MAKLKYEVLAQRRAALGLPLRDRLFASIALLSRIGTHAGAPANMLARWAPVRALMQRYGGIHKDRPLPEFASETFSAWFRHRSAARAGQSASRGDAVYFADTFTNYFHPEVGQAAVRVLEALGYRVLVVERMVCCGRPAISKGALREARGWARKNVDALLPFARRGVPIVGTEPSCILTFRDEYPDLLRDDDARSVAGQSMLVDELIAKLAAEDDSLGALFRSDLKREVLLHAHCHQKANAGADPTLAALRIVPGQSVRLIDSGCCGMAGSFGFEAEHYEISRAMGALRLFPAVEAASVDTEIAVTGVSCRQQIGHFTSRRPRHAIELLAEALA